MVTIKIYQLILIIIGCVVSGIGITILTDGFTNFDGLFEYGDDEITNEELDSLYDQAILNEGYYAHGRITKEDYLTMQKQLLEEVKEIEHKIKKDSNI